MPSPSQAVVDSPLGPLRLAAADGAITAVAFARPGTAEGVLCPPSGGVLAEVGAQLQAYFAGELAAFDLPLAPEGTAFQRQVWEGIARIPYGQTTSYGKLAADIGRPRAVRAAAAACGRNPITVVVPCHRVVGSDGRLTGYGGGLERKRFLLTLEGTLLP